jgi:hypothetical protein
MGCLLMTVKQQQHATHSRLPWQFRWPLAVPVGGQHVKMGRMGIKIRQSEGTANNGRCQLHLGLPES